jgi:DNA adenine methylase
MSSEARPLTAKPFLKWVGGKTQLLAQFEQLLPSPLRSGLVKHYFEPFLGGGAMLFDLLSRFGPIEVDASDLNPDLINCYRAIQSDVDALIERLSPMSERYLAARPNQRRTLFYRVRDEFNATPASGQVSVDRAAQLLFLNKTCFNGLYRVNRQGRFNTPSGVWKQTNPRILDAENLRAVSAALQTVRLECGAYNEIESRVAPGDFVYFDPPYRPLTSTAQFESYTAGGFGDDQQRELAACFTRLARRGVLVMLSNSDPRSSNPDDDFFDELYRDFTIHRVQATRMVNARATGRGRISEIVVTSWQA